MKSNSRESDERMNNDGREAETIEGGEGPLYLPFLQAKKKKRREQIRAEGLGDGRIGTEIACNRSLTHTFSP